MNSDRIDLAQLRCLVALVEEASVSRAARRLALSQPAASHALKRLRLLFEDPLLIRAGGGMRATPRARELLEEARALVAGAERLMAPRAAFDPARETGLFSLSAPEYVEHLLAPALVNVLAREAPGASLRIRPPNPEQAERLLESGELDLRLGWVRDPSASMRSRLLMQDDFVCLARIGHPSVHGPITVQQYAALQHVRSESAVPSTLSRQIDAAMRNAGAALRVALVVPSHLTIGRVVAGTDLVATLPRRIALNLAAQQPLQVLPAPVRIPALRVAMYWHERMQRDARHRWLRSTAAQAAQAAWDRTGPD